MVDPGQVGMGILDAYRMGRQEREQRDYKSALGEYAMNPNPVGLGKIAQYDPGFVIAERGRLAKQQQAEQVAQIGQRALKGDVNALDQLFQLDPDLWHRLDERQKGQLKQTNEYMGQTAMQIGRLPEAERATAWANAVKQAEQGGMDIPDYLEVYSPQSLDTAVRMAGKVESYIKQFEPHYMAIPEGGTLVNTTDPGAVSRFGAGGGGGIQTVSSPEEAKKLPPGTQFRTPDGRTLRVPGGAARGGDGPFGP